MARFAKRHGVVATPQPLAAGVGADILTAGGNAVDAAVAGAFAQGVVDPFMGGIGGFGCAVVHHAGVSQALSYHGKVGSLGHESMFADDVLGQITGHAERYAVKGNINQIGYRSVVTPGMPAGLAELHSRYGILPWSVVLEPAIALAQGGFPLPQEVWDVWTEIPDTGHCDGWTRVNATPSCAELFVKEGRLLQPGEVLRLPDYAATLTRLAVAGAMDFYRGDIAREIISDFESNHGLLTKSDLANYVATWETPVKGTYRGRQVMTAPLPASGAQLVQMLSVLERSDSGNLWTSDESEYVNRVARIMQVTFHDRAVFMGDPNFIDVDMEWLLSSRHLDELAKLACQDSALQLADISYVDSPYTTHISVIDDDGTAVSLTHTLGSGSGVVVNGLGFVFNNCMYQFNPLPGTPNSIAPGKSRLSGIAPTVVLEDGTPWLAIGGSGGTRIPTALLHTLLHMIDHDMSAVEALDYPRFHAEGAFLELESRLAPRVRPELEELGWDVRTAPAGYDRRFALAVVAEASSGGGFRAGSDPRSGGGTAFAGQTGRFPR